MKTQKRIVENETKTTLNRREALGILGSSVAAIASVSFLAHTASLPAKAEAGEELAGNGVQKYFLTTRTKNDIPIDIVAEPNQIVFTIKGAIPSGCSTPLMVFSNTEEQVKQEEAALQLLAASGSFMTPRDVELKNRKSSDKICVRFMFLGEQSPSRRIELKIVLKDKSENILKTMSRRCIDERLPGKIPVVVDPAMPSRVNTENFYFEKELTDKIGEILITFNEV